MKTQKQNLKLVREAFDRLEFLNNITWTQYREKALKLAMEEEKGHRGWGPDFRKHHPNAVSIKDAARMFIVKRIAEYVTGEEMPKGKAFLHTQQSCFYAAGLVDEYRDQIVKAWAALNVSELCEMNYVQFVSPEENAA